jgi:hypothetical protein
MTISCSQMETQYYTIKDFEDFVFETTYKLSSDIMQIIRNLEQELHVAEPANDAAVSANKKQVYVDKKKTMGGPRRPETNNGKYSKNTKEITNNDWETLRSFKSTKIETKCGVEKHIGDIRVLLNKISNKNYDTQKEVIKVAISNFMKEIADLETRDVLLQKLSKDLFNIMSTNKFFSELYTNLYKELLTEFDFLSEKFLQEILVFKHTIDSIQYCDPNIDYDNFCNYTKINDTRRATTMFIVNMFKNKIIDAQCILDILHYFLQKSLEFIETENKINELEEITENIYLIVSNCHVAFDDCTNGVDTVQSETCDFWKNTVLPIIIQISQMKLKEHKSLSNRFLFKYMDIIDSLE